MGPSSTLPRYVGRIFLSWFLILMVALVGVIFVFEFVEMVRRASSRPDVTIGLALRMTLLKLPDTIEVLFHFGVLFGAMLAFWRLSRSQELVVARAAGISAWQFLMPVLALAAMIGLFKIALLNPISAAMFARYEQLDDRYFQGQSQILDISTSGVWLRQRDAAGYSVIHAERTAADAIRLSRVIVFLFDENEDFVGRIDAATAALANGYWDLRGTYIKIGSAQPEYVPEYRLPTDLTVSKIQESFASPKTLSFWDLPDFINTLDNTGFSSLRHRLHYNSLLAQPILLAAMVLFAAAFSLRHSGRGGTLLMVVAGVLTGFLLFVLNDVVMALGLAENIPVIMAAWTPAGVGILIGTATLLHLEDG